MKTNAVMKTFLTSLVSALVRRQSAETGGGEQGDDHACGDSRAADSHLQAAVSTYKAGLRPLLKDRGPARSSALQQIAYRDAHGFGQGLDGGNAGIALACLDPRYLRRMDAAALAHGLLGQLGPFASLAQVLAERALDVPPAGFDAHAGDRRP